MLESLAFRSLLSCGIGDQGAIAIGKVLRVTASVTVLDLEHNNIGDSGAAAIANAIAVNASLKLETLYVDDAILGNPQLVAACRAKGVELV